ncbi:hydrolase [Streptomyces sp. SPB78]|nr:hydrolase [Streptomyces sp. SPB78]
MLGGLSMGGQIAMECVRRFGTRVRGLLLVGTTPEAESPEGVRARVELAARLEREGMAPYTAEALPRMIATPPGSTVTAHVRRMMHGTPPAGAAAALRGRARRPDYRQALSRFTGPALVVLGEQDTFFFLSPPPGSSPASSRTPAWRSSRARPTSPRWRPRNASAGWCRTGWTRRWGAGAR